LRECRPKRSEPLQHRAGLAQPQHCYSPGIEVGDPLELQPTIHFEVPLGGRSYNFPDVAFLSWFSHAPRSGSVNGWQTLLNSLSTASSTCSFEFFYVGAFQFNSPTTDPAQTYLTGINNNKQVVGSLRFGSASFAFIANGFDPANNTLGSFSFVGVPVPGAPGYVYGTLFNAINDAGVAVGAFFDGTMVHGVSLMPSALGR
jgi:hypothetical protein